MKKTILVLNAGSSSVKFAVAKNKKIILHGMIDHFGVAANLRIDAEGEHQQRTLHVANVHSACTVIHRLLASLHITPTVVAHRIVHGGRKFSKPTRLTISVIDYLHELIELAPLHQPANLLGVEFSERTWPAAQQWGVFDTALYQHLSATVKTYALPTKLAHKLHIEKYGFHGLSHGWAFKQAVKILQKPAKDVSVVTIHLGSGDSMTLWHNGRPIDTTMGFTPLEGLVMATRSGDIDPAIPLYIQKKLGWSASRVKDMLEQHSGLIGISGLKDMRDILSAVGHPVAGWPTKKWSAETRIQAKLALDIFSYHIRRTLSGYLGLLEHPQAIVFTGPIGQSELIQNIIVKNLPAARGIRRISVTADEEQAIVDAVGA